MKRIALSGRNGHDKYTLVDDEDYEYLSQFRWFFTTGGYVRGKLKGRMFSMHRMIIGAKAGEMVDHANGDTLDNRRENLRICTPRENSENRGPHRSPGKSAYKGVRHNAQLGWFVRIRFNGKLMYLGRYASEIDAAKAYDAAARYYHGEFARTNFEGDLALGAEDVKKMAIHPKKTSQYRGVYLGKGDRWFARISLSGRTCTLGSFLDEAFTARVYDAAVRYHYGEFSKTNFPGDVALSVEYIRRNYKAGTLNL